MASRMKAAAPRRRSLTLLRFSGTCTCLHLTIDPENTDATSSLPTLKERRLSRASRLVQGKLRVQTSGPY